MLRRSHTYLENKIAILINKLYYVQDLFNVIFGIQDLSALWIFI